MKGIIWIIFPLFLVQIEQSLESLSGDIARNLKQDNRTVLSRKRRYLVFPEGSSFQVVFDLTYPSVAIEGNVFVFGHTAAMAWELPSKPIFLDKNKLKKEGEKDDKAATTTTTTMKPDDESLNDFSDSYDDHDWKSPLPWDYPEKRPITWTNHRYDGSMTYWSQNPSQFWKESTIKRNFVTYGQKFPTSRISVAHHIHRRSRRELYSKIEKLLAALSKDGKSCVLKAICQANQLPPEKGTLWEEIAKAVFKAKRDAYPDEDRYDEAANLSHDCDQIYPNCQGHVLSSLFRNRLKK